MKQIIFLLLLLPIIVNGQNLKISQLPRAGIINGMEIFPIVQSGITKKIEIDSIKKYCLPSEQLTIDTIISTVQISTNYYSSSGTPIVNLIGSAGVAINLGEQEGEVLTLQGNNYCGIVSFRVGDNSTSKEQIEFLFNGWEFPNNSVVIISGQNYNTVSTMSTYGIRTICYKDRWTIWSEFTLPPNTIWTFNYIVYGY